MFLILTTRFATSWISNNTLIQYNSVHNIGSIPFALHSKLVYWIRNITKWSLQSSPNKSHLWATVGRRTACFCVEMPPTRLLPLHVREHSYLPPGWRAVRSIKVCNLFSVLLDILTEFCWCLKMKQSGNSFSVQYFSVIMRKIRHNKSMKKEQRLQNFQYNKGNFHNKHYVRECLLKQRLLYCLKCLQLVKLTQSLA